MSAPPSPEGTGKLPPLTPAEIEQIKLMATYTNTGASSLFTVGVAAPSAAAVFGFGGATYPFAPLTLAVGMPIFFSVSLLLHLLARKLLKGLNS